MENDFNISELFLIMADNERTFPGVIVRETVNDVPICYGSVIVEEGEMFSKAETEEDLTQNLDEICKMKLDHDLHGKIGETTTIMGQLSYLN